MKFFVLYVETEPNFFVAEITGDNVAIMESTLEASTKNCHITMYDNEQSFKDGVVGTVLKSKSV